MDSDTWERSTCQNWMVGTFTGPSCIEEQKHGCPVNFLLNASHAYGKRSHCEHLQDLFLHNCIFSSGFDPFEGH